MSVNTPHQVKIPFVSQKVEDLLLWRDPKRTGILVGLSTVVFAFFFLINTPFVSIVFYTAGFAVLLVTVWSRFGRSVGKPMPGLPPYLRSGMSETDYKVYADRMKPHVDKALSWANHVLSCRDLAFNAKTCATLFAAGKLLSYMSPISIVFLFMVLAFSMPKIYEMHKPKIDEQAAKARDHAVNAYGQARSRVNSTIEQSPALKQMRSRMSAATSSMSGKKAM